MPLAAPSLLSLLLAGCLFSRSVGEAQEGDGDCEVLLLQASVELQRRTPVQPEEAPEQQAPQAHLLESALPLVYVHVPKTGSSILNTLVRLPGVCPDLAEEIGSSSFGDAVNGDQMTWFREHSCPELIAPLGNDIRHNASVGDHTPLGNDSHFEEHYAGHAVTMLRQPEQRVISGLRHHAEIWELDGDIESLQFSEGCAVRMFVGEGMRLGEAGYEACFAMNPDQPHLPEVSSEDVARAVARLQTFAFVGITEEWPLSVCLLHAMFGGECVAVEFGNTRIGHSNTHMSGNAEIVFEDPEPYDTGFLDGWIDAADRALYDAGLEMFDQLRLAHGVTLESCRPCFQNAGLL